jgi:hypothetical protein
MRILVTGWSRERAPEHHGGRPEEDGPVVAEPAPGWNTLAAPPAS